MSNELEAAGLVRVVEERQLAATFLPPYQAVASSKARHQPAMTPVRRRVPRRFYRWSICSSSSSC